MPVQVLPYIPSFLEKLTPYLAQAGADIGEGYQQRSAMKGLQALLNPQAAPETQNANQPVQPDQVQQNQQMQQAQQAPTSPLQNLTPINAVQTFKLAEKALGAQGAKVLIDNLMQNQKLREKENIDIRKEERKEGREEKDKILAAYEAAEGSRANLDRMEKLESSGKLAKPWQALVSQKIGIPMSILSTPQSEEFEKLVAQRGLNVAQAYGFGRILQTEYENFLRSIPTLMNSSDGRKRITKTLRYFDDLAIKRYDIYKQLRKNSKEQIPSNLKDKVSELMEPEYEKARQFLLQDTESEKQKISLDDIFGE